MHVFYKREHFIETVESHHEDLNDFYSKLKPLMKSSVLKINIMAYLLKR
jgi:hypothetical protein